MASDLSPSGLTVAKVKDRVVRAVAATHAIAYRVSGGRIGGRVAGVPVLLLTTRGRRSGKRRVTPLGYVEDGPRVVLVASYGGDRRHPAWYRNLEAHPEVRVTQGRATRTMVARTATEAERARLWPRVVAAYGGYQRYQERTSREIPLVVLTEPGAAAQPFPSPSQDGPTAV